MKTAVLLLVSLTLLKAIPEDAANLASALKGRTYFAPKSSVSASSSATLSTPPRKSVKIVAKPSKYIENVSESSSSSSSISESSSSVSVSESSSNSSDNSSASVSLDSESDSSLSSCSSSSSISEAPACRLSRPPPRPLIPRIDFQRPWCPGQVMASLVPRAMDPIYDWKNPLTCSQFASNFGGVSVLVGELGGPDFCSAGPSLVYSNYTITRSMSINEPIYARVESQGVEFAAAAGPILYPEGLVLYISVAKEVAKLPQVCN